MHIDHIGIAVQSLEKSNLLYELLLKTPPYKSEEVQSEGVITSFFMTGESKVELLMATHSESPIQKFIEKKGEGIHHIAFAVENIEDEIARLKKSGIQFIAEIPKKGADNKLICFLHPKSTGGVLIELCQDLIQ